mmetsp:Transcript_22565/g.42524  ORF Transcript_22565/g.42524 Transcript_22565/m.42524 type:complete len:414 (+) Transcript_22565:69-1310(+)
MKQVLVASSMALAAQLGFSLKVPASFLETESGDCFGYTCGKGYVPKFDHHEIAGSSDGECCQPTCELWECKGHFAANDAYKGNLGNSNEQCCDKTCSALTCPKGQKVPSDLAGAAGMAPKDCCKDTCANIQCAPFHVPNKANQDAVFPDDEAQSFCCRPTCQAYTCDFRKGLTLDKSKKHLTDVSDATCCTATCSSVSCPTGFKTRPANVNEDARSVECCEPLCSSHTCSKGWLADELRANKVGNTDEECCQRTCELYECSSGWTANPASARNIGVDDETCCAKTCIQFQDKCVGDYAPNPAKNDTVGQSPEKCCSKTCALHTCGTGALIPNGKSVVGGSDDLCCEDSRCAALRAMTKAESTCNGVSEDDCTKKYVELTNTKTNKTDILACTWSELGICQVGKPQPTDCVKVE